MTELKLNQIYKGDCVSLIKKLKPESIDMVFADPPYNLSGKSFALKGNMTGGDWTKVNEKGDVYTGEGYKATNTINEHQEYSIHNTILQLLDAPDILEFIYKFLHRKCGN